MLNDANRQTILATICVGCLIAVAFFASYAGQPSRPVPQANGVDSKQYANNPPKAEQAGTRSDQVANNPMAPKSQVLPLGGPGEGPPDSANGEAQGTEFWSPILGYRLKITDTLIVAFTALLFLATLALWLSTRRLVIGAEETAKHQLRAYVLLDGGAIRTITTDAGRIMLLIDIKMKNSGQTPAYNFRSWYGVEILYPKDAPKYTMGGVETPSPIGPGGEMDHTLRKEITEGDIVLIRQRKMVVHIWGRYDYTDIFDEPRYFELFLKNGNWEPPGAWSIIPAEQPSHGN
jgi:hypothetical protein